MTICWPSWRVSTADNGRANASVPPPLGKGAIRFTGLFGHADCACTKGAARAPPAASSRCRRESARGRREGMSFVSVCQDSGLGGPVKGSKQRRDRTRLRHFAVHEFLV